MIRPEIKKQDRAVTIDVVVNLNCGLCVRPAARIVEECAAFVRKDGNRFGEKIRGVYLVDSSGAEYDCTSALNLLTSAAEQGKAFKIKVEGEDNPAEQLALRLYSALTSEDSLNLDFYRFEPGLKPED